MTGAIGENESMLPRPKTATVLVAIAVMIAAPSSARAEGSGMRLRDHELARRGLEEGAILPLDKVLAAVRSQLVGEIAGIELEHERDRWVYEIKLIKPNGAVVELYVDAKTGTIVKEKSK